MEDWDLGDHEIFPQLEPKKLLKSIYYEDARVTRLDPLRWVARIECIKFLNMLYVPHFKHNIINTICVHQLLSLVHDGCLWMGGPIPIDKILVHRIIVLPYQGTHPIDDFVGKS